MGSKEKKNFTPVRGKKVEDNYLKSFYPTPTKGMKWTYVMSINIQGLDISSEMIMEIVYVKGDKVKIRTTLGEESVENTTDIESFFPVPSNNGPKSAQAGFIFRGLETVKVPMGDFFDSPKLTNKESKEEKCELWLSKGVGPIQFNIISSGVPATLKLRELIK